jgi:hypothetical protein
LTTVGTVTGLQLRRMTRRRWIGVAIAAGVAVAALIAAFASGEAGLAREDEMRQGAASLLLLGGLLVAAILGATALNRDSDSGHFGMLMGGGISRSALVAGALAARTLVLVVVVGVWGLALQGASVAIGLGADGELAVHTLVVGEALLFTMIAAAAASSVVGAVASALFAVSVYLTAQAMMNLKAAADQDLIGTARSSINGAYYISPRVPTSPMLAELQERGAAGPAVPRVDINGNEVLLPASGWPTVAATLVWVAILAALAYAGMRRRPIA